MNCAHCGKPLGMISDEYHGGFGAGSGSTWSERRACRQCGKGCYVYEKDDIPGFRDSTAGPCCNCGE